MIRSPRASNVIAVGQSIRGAAARKDGSKVVLGIRPENIRGAGSEGRRPQGPVVPIRVVIEFVEPLGHEVIIHGRIGDDLLVAKTEPHHAPQVGDELQLEIELAGLHVFDAETEMRLRAA